MERDTELQRLRKSEDERTGEISEALCARVKQLEVELAAEKQRAGKDRYIMSEMLQTAHADLRDKRKDLKAERALMSFADQHAFMRAGGKGWWFNESVPSFTYKFSDALAVAMEAEQ